MTLNYCTIITPKVLFEHITLIQETAYFNVYRYRLTKGVIFRLPKNLEEGVACHVFMEHEINLSNTLKTKTLTLKVQVTFVPVSYGLFCGFDHLEGRTDWIEDERGYDREDFVPNYDSDKNVKRVAGLPPKVPLNMIEYLKEILFQEITEAEMISKYAISLGCQTKALQNMLFVPIPTVSEVGDKSSTTRQRERRTLRLFEDLQTESVNLLPKR